MLIKRKCQQNTRNKSEKKTEENIYELREKSSYPTVSAKQNHWFGSVYFSYTVQTMYLLITAKNQNRIFYIHFMCYI